MNLCRLWRLSAALVAAFLLLGHVVWAQAITQSGPILNGGGHAPMYIGGATGQSLASVMDSGPAAGGPVGTGLSEKLLQARVAGTGPDGTHDCDYSGYVVNNPTPPNWLCWDANALGGGLIDFYSPSGQPLQLKVNGVISQLPFNITGGTNFLTIAQFGAICNGTGSDSSAIQTAINTSALGGGPLIFNPTGHACVITSGLIMPSGSVLRGSGTWTSPSTFDNTEGDWTKVGSYFHCEDTVNPCITITGPGYYLGGVNFWYTQPTPPNATQCPNPCTYTHGWTPTPFPQTILINDSSLGGANFGTLEQIHIVNGYNNCVDYEGNDGLAGMYSHEDHVYIGCFGVGQKMAFIDNAMTISDIKFELPWMNYSSDVLGWTEGGHKIDLDLYYSAGLTMISPEFDFSSIAIRAQNQQVVEPFGTLTFAAQALTLVAPNFNEVCRGIYVPPTSLGTATVFQANISDAIANTDFVPSPVAGQCANGSGGSPWFFDLQSDGADVSFHNIEGLDVQGLLALGGGTAGKAHVYGARTLSYSNYTNGGNAYLANAGAQLDVAGDLDNILTLNPAAGTKISSSGAGTFAPLVAGDLSIDGLAGSARKLNFTTMSTNCAVNGCFSNERWSMNADNVAESGSNAGSNFGIYRYSDAGTFIDIPIGIIRSTGVLSINDGATVTGPLTQATVTIAQLPACSGVPIRMFVSNGIASPTFQQAVSSTGSSFQSVICNGSSWIYQ